jgi:HEAT repeat protein
MNALAKQEDWGSMGDAMRALPNDQVRAFVRAYVVHPPGQGALLNSYISAGYGNPDRQARDAIKECVASGSRVVAAVREEAVKVLRLSHPEAVNTLLECMRDKDNKDRWKCARAILERTDPTMTHNRLDITHRVIDPDQEALDELRAARSLGASREKLIELFGSNELPRLERLEAKKTEQAKVIEGETIDG